MQEQVSHCMCMCVCVLKLRRGKSPPVVTAERKRVTNVKNINNNNDDEDEHRLSSSPAAPRLPLNTSATLRPAQHILMDRMELLKLPPNRCFFLFSSATSGASYDGRIETPQRQQAFFTPQRKHNQ